MLGLCRQSHSDCSPAMQDKDTYGTKTHTDPDPTAGPATKALAAADAASETLGDATRRARTEYQC